ncbi:DUF4865 family protein [Streptomyces sp. N2-109]|uniref:DUF4865 family protein n=1 Tax=Streptomyces gossypii TaxID=2883101 RepID=A0ABT2K206_9ACTN|nr:DUF4865 family protein [Streptomyces gossypii]MCT2594188.1 DUF4865 family protein [Streptomyces gossypii]
MHALQYEITLPADYEMDVIRRRVRSKGHLLDGWPGLGLKAFAIRERGKDGSTVNQYAPFYLWTDHEALTGFLRGPGFQGLSDDFGRPAVRNWHGLAHEHGPAHGETPRVAERLMRAVPEGGDTATTIDLALDELRAVVREPGVHSAALGLDPHRWELVRFVLRILGVPGGSEGEQRYEVLHLSQGTTR